MKNITVGSIFKPISRVLGRFHMTIFIVFITAGLTVAVIFLNGILTDTSTADGYMSPIDAGSIDQTTLERIRELHTSNETPSATVIPDGRINPFGE